MKIRTSERKSYTEFNLTAAEGAPERLFSEVADVLSGQRVQPILEKIYGRLDAQAETLKVRAAQYGRRGLDPSLPYTYLEGRPLTGEPLAGLQLWGLTGGAEVRTVRPADLDAGRAWSAGGVRFLYLPSIRGREPGGALASTAERQAQCMFRAAEAALRAEGFRYTQVVRTWIYLARLLKWYGGFNRVRTDCYREFGIGGAAAGPVFPASTGIQARAGDEECVMDLLAIDPGKAEGVAIQPIRRARQHEPFAYGSSFSRGVSVRFEGRTTVYVSGTASINAAGESVHRGNPEAQSAETLLNLAAVLETAGAGLDDIGMATLFCRNEAAREAFLRVTRLLRVPEFPMLSIRADICRADLELEVEAVAAL